MKRKALDMSGNATVDLDVSRQVFGKLSRETFDRPAVTRICNASSRDPYTPQAWPVRAGAEDHKQFKSLKV